MKSTHKAEVVPIKLEPHPNADSLSVVKVFGYTVVVKTDQWKDKNTGIYIVPDTLVDTTRPEFSFLHTNKTWERIKIKKLRGIISMGLLIPSNSSDLLGEDKGPELGIKRYEETIDVKSSNCVSGPEGYHPKYDIDSYLRYSDLISEDEPLIIMEKINGSNGRYVFTDKQYCGSRTQWKADENNDMWWYCYHNQPEIKNFCETNPDYVLYGEVYGKVGGFKYGQTNPYFRAFDIMLPCGDFMNGNLLIDTCNMYDIPMPPTIHIGKATTEELLAMAEGQTLLEDSHVREGVVVRPFLERKDDKIGRVILKIVGNGYYIKG